MWNFERVPLVNLLPVEACLVAYYVNMFLASYESTEIMSVDCYRRGLRCLEYVCSHKNDG